MSSGKRKIRVSCTLDEGVLEKIDKMANDGGSSRSAAISKALVRGMSSPSHGKEPTGVFVRMGSSMLEIVEAWAARTGNDDVGEMLFDGFLASVDVDDLMHTATVPCSARDIARRMSSPGAPTEGIGALWLDPATEGTMHPRFAYEQKPGAVYRPGRLMRYLGMSGEAMRVGVVDPVADGYRKVWDERG